MNRPHPLWSNQLRPTPAPQRVEGGQFVCVGQRGDRNRFFAKVTALNQLSSVSPRQAAVPDWWRDPIVTKSGGEVGPSRLSDEVMLIDEHHIVGGRVPFGSVLVGGAVGGLVEQEQVL